MSEPVLLRQLPRAEQLALAFAGSVRVVNLDESEPHDSSLFVRYLVHWAEPDGASPRRSTLVRVFPYALDEVPQVVPVMAFEVRCWHAWWRWIREDLERDDTTGIAQVAPLVESEAEAMGVATIEVAGQTLGYTWRPYLQWPSLAQCTLSSGQLGFLWKEFLHRVQQLGAELDEPLSVPMPTRPSSEPPPLQPTLPSTIQDLRHLLCDGRRLAPTRWRIFHPRYRHLNADLLHR